MEKRLVTEAELKSYGQPIPEGCEVFGFRLVAVGPNTMELAKRMGAKICEIVGEQPGFFIISQSSEDIREIMHSYVDRFCDLREGKGK